MLIALFSLFFINTNHDFHILYEDKYIRHITFFSIYQAFLSTFFSIILSIFIALALYRRDFFFKKWLLRLFSMTFVLPVLVAVFGIVSIYGNSGLINSLFEEKIFNIYGLGGILLAHLFFNIPLASKIFYESLITLDNQQHKISAQLGLNNFRKFLYLEWPLIKQQLPSLATLIFTLCFTSFAIVLALGGGPKSTTIEVAIYQAIKYDFDFDLAAMLSILQIIICIFLAFLAQKFSKIITNKNFYDKNKNIFQDNKKLKVLDYFFISLIILLILPPLVSVVYFGLNENFIESILNEYLYKALFNSIFIAFCSAILTIFLTIIILLASRAYKIQGNIKKSNFIEISASIILLVPSLVISTGLFILLNNYIDVFSYALFLVIFINSLMALPFSIRSLSQQFFSIEQEYNKLCTSLGLFGINRLKLIEFKALKISLSNAIALSFILSFGDLSAIALFGSSDFKTLPLLLYEQLGSYQMNQAATSAFILLLISLLTYTIIELIFSKKDKNVRN